MLRKVIKISAADSPNVRLGREVFPNVLTVEELAERRATWDAARQRIGLDAEFPDDVEMLLWPEHWLAQSHERWAELRRLGGKRQAKAVGIDVGQGGANSVWCVGDALGVMELRSVKTPDTNDVFKISIDVGRVWGVPAEMWVFDLGGGGKQHVDRLRASGLRAQGVAFGTRAQVDIKHGLTMIGERREVREDKAVYASMRVQMHAEASALYDPANGPPFAVAAPREGPQWDRLWRQMRVIPKLYDEHGKMVLPDKEELAALHWGGASPDELDALVLMHWGLAHKPHRAVAGVG